MTDQSIELMHRIRSLERELETIFENNQREFGYSWEKGKTLFEKEITGVHSRLKRHLAVYVLHSRLLVVVTAPVIY